MPTIDQVIADWRTHLLDSASLNRHQVDELEDHLRDEVARLTKMGLSELEAYAVARVLVGSPDEITKEFGKVNPLERWRNRLLWMLGGYTVYTLIHAIAIRPIGLFVSHAGQQIGLTTPWTIALTFLVLTAGIGLILALLILTLRRRSVSNKSIKRLQIAPWLTLVLLALGISLVPMIAGVTNVLSVRVFDPQTLGTAALSLSIMQFLVVPILLLVALCLACIPKRLAQ